MASWYDLKGTLQKVFRIGTKNVTIDANAPTAERTITLPDSNIDFTGGSIGNVLTKTGATTIAWAAGGGGGSSKYVRGFGIDGFATTGTNKALSVLISSSATIQSIKAYARTAPTGASLIFDINKNGVSIFATAGDRLTIAAGSNTSTVGTFSTSLAADDVLELDIDQVGSTASGQDIVIVIELA